MPSLANKLHMQIHCACDHMAAHPRTSQKEQSRHAADSAGRCASQRENGYAGQAETINLRVGRRLLLCIVLLDSLLWRHTLEKTHTLSLISIQQCERSICMNQSTTKNTRFSTYEIVWMFEKGIFCLGVLSSSSNCQLALLSSCLCSFFGGGSGAWWAKVEHLPLAPCPPTCFRIWIALTSENWELKSESQIAWRFAFAPLHY